ncbi:MAG: hypothetical protein IJ785_08370 [Bacteroidales bacterium]|nr:hypothetical protein [Bacteroidales bacterium]
MALAAISNQMTVSEIVEKYNVSKTMVYQWKDEFLSNASKVFESDRATRQQEKQIDNLHRKIGELEMDFAKRASGALGIGLPAKD